MGLLNTRQSRYFKEISLIAMMALVPACSNSIGAGSENIFWNKPKALIIAPVKGNIRVLVIDTPPPLIKFDGIAGNFGTGVAKGADTGARHGAMIGSLGVYGSCHNAGCAVLLLLTAALTVGGAAIGAIIGAIDGGARALGDSDDDEAVAARELAMKEALAALPVQKEMAIGVRQQLYETQARRIFFDDLQLDGQRRPYVERRPEYQIRIAEISAVRVDREGAVRLRLVASGRLLTAKSTAKPQPIIAEFLTDAYQLSAWFAEDAKLFRRSLLLGARLTSAKLVAKLQRKLPR